MSTFTYLVTVETERTAGLIASRDEQSDKIAESIEEAVQDTDISGIGARSDSDYEVVEVDIVEYDKKSLKAEIAQYEAAVVAAEPSNAQLRAELKAAKADAAAAKQRADRAERALAEAAEERELGKTRVWMGGGWDEDRKTYLPDGRHDHVYFRYGDHDTARFTVGFDDRNQFLEIRTDDAFGYIAALPISGNVLRVAMVPRDAL